MQPINVQQPNNWSGPNRPNIPSSYRYEYQQKQWGNSRMDGVLVIEDEPAIAMLLATIIEDYGYEVTVAFDGRQGFELARSGKYKLIITDNMLPYMSGREICARLKKEPAANGSIVVLMSAVTNSADMHNEAAAFLAKPFDITTIDQLVQRFLIEPAANRHFEVEDGAAHPLDEQPSSSKSYKTEAKSPRTGKRL